MWAFLKRISLVQWILLSLVIGIGVGVVAPEAAKNLEVISNIFLRLIKSIVVPILLGTLIVGIAGHGDDLKKIGRLGFRSILYFELATTVALAVGLLAGNLVRPGEGINLVSGAVAEGQKYAANTITFAGLMEHTFPASFFEAAAKNEVLQVVVFAVMFAVALTQVKPGKEKDTVLHFFEGISQVMFKYTGIVMSIAPLGIGAAIAAAIGKNGLGVLWGLGKLVLTLYGALVVFVILVFIPVALFARIPLREFWKFVKEPYLIAFSTASSEAALPLAMQRMEEFGVPRRIVSFVIPTGYSFNLDGSTLYLGIAALFVAQAAGIHLDIGTQLMIMLSLMLTTKGIAGVARASLVILSGTLVTFGLPLEGIAIILGVDAFMDMARTSVNLLGNCLASVVMARWEGEFRGPDWKPVELKS
jgi:proton glutamate symport protein